MNMTITKLKWLMPLGVLLLSLGACKPDPVVDPPPPPPAKLGTLRVTLVPMWEGEPMETFTEYRNFMDYRTTVQQLLMYFGAVRLVAGTDTLLVKDVDLFDLGSGPVSRSWSVAPGSWSHVRAKLGVPADLNYADPANYAANHPLSVDNGTHWTWNSGYRYVVFEGRYDSDPQSTAPLITAYSLHPGMEPSLVEFDLAPSNGITITAGQTTEVVVTVSVDRFFHSDEFEIDLATENTAHGTNVPLQWKLVNNIVKSFSL
jgi:hypothetical protein